MAAVSALPRNRGFAAGERQRPKGGSFPPPSRRIQYNGSAATRRRDQALRPIRVGASHAPVHRHAKVVLLDIEAVEPRLDAAALELPLRPLGDADHVLEVSHCDRLGGVGQPPRRVLTDCFEHPVPDVPAALLDLDERTIGEVRDQIQHGVGLDAVAGADGATSDCTGESCTNCNN
jgi:hypothetical protein